MKEFCLKVVIWVTFNLRVYLIWSKLYRIIWERKYSKTQLAKYTNFQDLATFIESLTWTADGFKQLGDAISTPQKVQWIANNTTDKKIGDCDEFAIYNATVINDALDNQTFVDRIVPVDAYCMSVCWLDQSGKFMGHNVCLLEFPNGMYRYMDYHNPSTSKGTIEEIAALVRASFSGIGTKSLGWMVYTDKLKFIRFGH